VTWSPPWTTKPSPITTRPFPPTRSTSKDARGRQYKVIRYAWLENKAAEGQPADWSEFWHMLLTENGGLVDPTEESGHFVIDGTGTEVELVEGETAEAA
jgi:hypothetical protein